MPIQGLLRRVVAIAAPSAGLGVWLLTAVAAWSPLAEARSLVPSAKERRAVRGRPAPELGASANLLASFEATLPGEAAPLAVTPQRGAPAPDQRGAPAPDQRGAPAPDELGGRWSGTGDEPLTTRHDPLLQPGPLAALYVDFFRKDADGRALLETWFNRLAPWRKDVGERLEAAALPPQWLLIPVASTGFDIEARGLRGEAGPWLLGASQARQEGLQVGYWLDERRDPIRSTEAAIALGRHLIEQTGSWPLAATALVFGLPTVETALTDARDGSADSPPLGEVVERLPRSARLFLARLAALAEVAGPALPREPLPAADIVEVPGALTLEAVARATGASLIDLRAYNPALLRDRVVPFVGTTSVRIPAVARRAPLAAFEAARGPADRVRVETLRLGETLETIVDSKGFAMSELRRINGVRDLIEARGPLDVLVPAQPVAVPPSVDAVVEPTLVAVPARRFDLPDRVRLFYFVVDGDTLDEVAEAAGVSSTEIVEWNNLDPHARLQGRMVLQLFVLPDHDRSRIALVDATRVRAVEVGSPEFHAAEVAGRGKTRVVHTARAGETMPKIARRYGLAVADLARINRMSWASELSDGQRLVVYAPSSASARGPGRETAAGRAAPLKRREESPARPLRPVSDPRGSAPRGSAPRASTATAGRAAPATAKSSLPRASRPTGR